MKVRCSGGDETGDPENICRDKKPEPNDQHGCGVGGEPVHDAENKLEAYSDSTYKDKSLTYSRITFCKDFFNMPSLSEAMDRNANKPPKAKEQLESWNNRARVFLHETTHLDYFMNAPGSSPLVDDLQFDWRQPGVGVTRDWAYGPKFCKILRNYGLQSESGKYPQRNGKIYKSLVTSPHEASLTLRCSGLLRMVCSGELCAIKDWHVSVTDDDLVLVERLTLRNRYPRQPRPRQVPKADPYNSGGGDVQASGVAALNKAQPDADLVSDSTFDAYQYANGFSTPGCPDNKIATKASVGASPPISSTGPSPAPPAADKNVCHGVSGDTWVVSRDVAANNVKDFCGQTDHTKKYNVGSDNELELSVKSLSDASKSPKDTPDCVGRFTRAILDGCDGNDKVNNPRNYKYGGTFTSGDGWEYKMTPLAKKTNGVTCDVNYKFFYDEFEIRGRYWPDAKLGIDGQGLLDKLRVCGVVSDWLFKPTPDDCCMQWYAYGKLPIGTRSCVGSAVVAAGGANSGSCNGAG